MHRETIAAFSIGVVMVLAALGFFVLSGDIDLSTQSASVLEGK